MASPVFQSGTFNKSARLLRRTSGRRDTHTGRWQDNDEGEGEPIVVIPQPAPADDQRQNIPGGARLTGAMNFYMEQATDGAEPIRVRSADGETTQSGGDIITYDGVKYEALIRVDWPDYVRITAVRVEGQ